MNSRNTLAYARIKGNSSNSRLTGYAIFSPCKNGTLVEINVNGLPDNNYFGVYPVHIHEGENCDINNSGVFNNIYSHFNPNNNPHPYHAGDLPDLFSNNGYAYMKIYTERFKIDDIIGAFIIIHDGVDNDYITYFGNKIGCGLITKYTY